MALNEAAHKGVRRFLFIQILLSLSLVAGFVLFSGAFAGLSAFLAALISVVPTQLFAAKLFKYGGAQAAKKIMFAFYWGEFLKLGLAIVLFIVVFKFFAISALAFFVTYIVLQMSIWLAPLAFMK